VFTVCSTCCKIYPHTYANTILTNTDLLFEHHYEVGRRNGEGALCLWR